MKITRYYDDIHIDKDTDWRDPLTISSPSNPDHNENSIAVIMEILSA